MKQHIEAAVFDIDGTLLPHGQVTINSRTTKALTQLRDTGIKVIVATGRAPFAARDALGTFEPDYLVCATGALAQNRRRKTIYANYMTQEEMYALVDYCEDDEIPLNFVYDEGYHVYVEFEKMRSLTTDSTTKFLVDSQKQVRHLQGMPYVGCIYAQPHQLKGFAQTYPHLPLRFIPFASGGCFYDIVHECDDKAHTVARVLAELGLNWQHAAAFGDGLNDEKMLMCAGMPVVMENGADCLKLPGRITAPPCDEDGAAQIIEQRLLCSGTTAQ